MSDVKEPEKFPFPFTPYDIQEDFMRDLYRVIAKGGIGIFESPTGTGKSLSLICSSLTWLKDFEEQTEKDSIAPVEDAQASIGAQGQQKDTDLNNNGLPDWVVQFGEKKKREEEQQKLKEHCDRLKKQKAELGQVKKTMSKGFTTKGKRKLSDDQVDERKENEIENEINEILGSKEPDADLLLAEYDSDTEKDDSSDDEEEVHCTKIYYCSRTHSQLAQFTREVQKSPFSDTRLVTLGSRQSFCINEDVKKLKSNNRISDRCLELKKNKSKGEVKIHDESSGKNKRKKKESGCPYDKQQQMFKDQVLVEIKDIEDLVSLGKELQSCPYYGTRRAIPAAQLVCLPYNILLNKSTRRASGIKLDGNVVIIDEAHNLLETINNIHSVEITGSQIAASFSQLSRYLERYRTRLKASNVMFVKQLLFVLKSFLTYLGGENTENKSQSVKPKTETKLYKINDFTFVTQIDNVNLFKICRFCESSLISQKLGFINVLSGIGQGTIRTFLKYFCIATVTMDYLIQNALQLNGFVDRYKDTPTQESSTNSESTSFISPMYLMENFLEALTNADVDGRVVVTKLENVNMSRMKFLLLNPAIHFTSVVQESRAVIVAGGTMQPTSEFKDQLFACAGMKPEQVHEFSCGHVIPDEQLLPIALDKGPSGIQLDFSYQSRLSPQLINECGRLLLNVCAVIPGGVVCFFPSFDYANKVYSHWESAGLLEKLNNKKKVFQEPRTANKVENVLNSYSNCIKKSGGAILLSVVGGKMSEGINFSDDLGRCVVMIGLPYPNITSPELREKMNYLNTTVGPSAGQEYYENLCMKAVNQSIGRAIRHRGDYATILLLDHRYSTTKVRNKLPKWISGRLEHHARFATAYGAVRKFFVDKRT